LAKKAVEDPQPKKIRSVTEIQFPGRNGIQRRIHWMRMAVFL